MPTVEVKNLVKKFGETTIVNDLSISVEKGEILALLGSSGCGKTTTLRCIAGLEQISGGGVWIDGKLMASAESSLPPERRGIGMIFQSYAIWPHMTVFENVAYGLKVKRMPRSAAKEAVMETLSSVQLADLARRYPSDLSGGQQQRVALARSIVTQPAVLLLDEPLSNLDAKLRETMRDELRDLIKRVGITAIHITHDQVEAMAIADRIAIMKDGVILQEGTGRDLYRRPESRFVADFVGDTTFVDATVEEVDGTRAVLRSRDGLRMLGAAHSGLQPGAAVSISIRPEAIEISPGSEKRSGKNAWVGEILSATFLGSNIDYKIGIDGQVLRASGRADVPVGAAVSVHIDPDDVFAMPAAGEPVSPSRTPELVGQER